MDFDIVVATRNRRTALEISLPLMLNQSRLPRQLIVVDASDDHEEVRKTIDEAVAPYDGRVALEIIRSDPGSAHQRNVGLEKVASPVVFFPDDDALWFPHYSASVMDVYEKDRDGRIGGVGGSESPFPPPGVLDGETSSPYRMEIRDRLQLLVGRFFDVWEHRLFPDPILMEGDERGRGRIAPEWLREDAVRPASAFPGFLMSFRTNLIRAGGFDPVLGTYALFEDYDASLSVLGTSLLVEAQKARVFHYRVPQKRMNGVEWGAIQILNRAYVVCKHSPPGSKARRRLLPYSYYKLARYALQGQSRYGRERVRGAMKALGSVRQLVEAPGERLTQTYRLLREKCLS